MVHCIVVGCGNKSGKHKTNFSKIPKIVVNQGEEWEELMRERRNRWISAVSRGDTEVKNFLESERVCARHFVSGRPSACWDKHNVDWVPTLNLGTFSSPEPLGLICNRPVALDATENTNFFIG